MKTVRQRILEFIRSHRAVTAAELSQVFQISPANARHHLSILMEQGLVEAIDRRPAAGKGRPARVFSLSRLLSGDNLDMLASALLELASAGSLESPVEVSIQPLVDLMLDKMRVQVSPPSSFDPSRRNLTRDLNQLTQMLNNFFYDARWEAHAGKPRMIFGHCPYASIIADHPELCKMDAGIIEQSLGVSVAQTAKRVKDASGLLYCLFLISIERV